MAIMAKKHQQKNNPLITHTTKGAEIDIGGSVVKMSSAPAQINTRVMMTYHKHVLNVRDFHSC